MLSSRLPTWIPAALLLLASAAHPAPAQITTNTALPVTQGHGVLRPMSKVIRATGSGPMNRELTAYGVQVVGAYGVTERWTLFGVVPLLDKNLSVRTPQGRWIERGPTGLGDVRLFARYTVWTRNRAGQTQRFALLPGVEMPSGADDETDKLGRLPQPLQLGSGSWDPLAGLVFTWQTLQWQVDVSPVYQFTTQANNFEFGDEVRLDVASKYRLWPRELSGGVPGFLYGNLETTLIRHGNNEKRGREVSSGGTTWFVAPGLQYVTRRFVIEGAVQLPVVQDLGGTALERDFITTVSLRINI